MPDHIQPISSVNDLESLLAEIESLSDAEAAALLAQLEGPRSVEGGE
jgi:hypothetical protein